MKKSALVYCLIIFISILSIGKIGIKGVKAENVDYYGFILMGNMQSDYVFQADSQYVYHLMNEHYNFEKIYFLSMNTSQPGVTNATNFQNLNWSITDLRTKSGSNDVIWFWFATHGSGYDSLGAKRNYTHNEDHQEELRSMLDTNGDEGNETWENTIGFDVNNDGDTDDCIGIDEIINLNSDANVTDDWLNASLSSLDYSKLIVSFSSCMGGGFVDDLSGPNRTIITACNETDYAARMQSRTIFSPWAQHFLDALHGERMNWTRWNLIHLGEKVDADTNGDYEVSLLEAWDYAWNNTFEVQIGWDIPWLDDNGNGLPTYWNETDNWTGWPSSIPCDNGTLAGSTWFPKKYGWFLTVETSLVSGQEITGVDIWVDGSLAGDSSLTLNVTVGSHKVKAEHSITYQGYNYYLSYWNGTNYPNSNPTYVHLHENKTIKACYDRTVYMQKAKWDSTYWKMLWNNTATHNTYSKSKSGYSLSGYLGVRIYNGTSELTNETEDPIEVGRWFNLQSEIKNKTWELSDDVNVTGTYIQVKIYYKFQGDSWTYMGVTFKTETFGQNTILNATRWNIYLYGSYYVQGGPLKGPLGGPGGQRSGISFSWGCSARKSRIEDMILFSPP